MTSFGSDDNGKTTPQFEQRRSWPADAKKEGANEAGKKARNRLIGAAVLVLAAIIIVPMLFKSNDNQPTTTEVKPPLVTPNSGQEQGADGSLTVQTAPGVAPQAGTDTNASVANSTTGANGMVAQEEPEPAVSVAQSTNPEQPPAESTEPPPPEAQSNTNKQEPTVASATAPNKDKAQAKVKPKAVQRPGSKITIADKDRTDDGAKALALLEGNSANKSSKGKVASGSFNLQVASYASASDARTQREKLQGSGVSNAHIQAATVNGKEVFRLRVGPFSSREAAQAAQTRIRALNFDGSYISNN